MNSLNFPVQSKHHICWGQEGLSYYGSFFEAIVIVDVLSFCTTVDIVLSKGCSVVPTKIENEGELISFSEQINAVLAKKRSKDGVTLSPSSMQYLSGGETILLPSPNGSTLVDIATQFKKPIFTGCLRNGKALSEALNKFFPVLCVAAGERYPNKMLRPSIEDYWGVGSILSGLTGEKTIEVQCAVESFLGASSDLKSNLKACESGQELICRGFDQDVELAAEYDVSNIISYLSKNNTYYQLIKK